MARKPRKPLTLAQRRANPATRSKLPMSQLTPAQQATRRKWQQVKAENANSLYDPTVQLGGHSLAQAARDLADIDVAPKFNALNRQLTSATTQGSALAARSGDYYRQLAHEEAGKFATQQALAGMLNQQTANVGAQTQAAFSQMGQAEQQRQAQDTALRGQGLGGDTTTVPAEIQAQQGTAATLQQAAGNQAAAQGADWAGLANAMATSRQARGGEVQGQLLNRVANQQQNLRGQISDVEATRGDLESQNVQKLRQQSFENLITQQGLNIKSDDIRAQIAGIDQRAKAATQKTRLDTRKFKADQAYKQAQIDIKRGVDPITGKRIKKGTSAADALNQWKLDYARKHGHLPSTGGGSGGGGGLTVAQQAAAGKAWSRVQDALGLAGSARITVDAKGRPTSDPTQATGKRPATMNETVAQLRHLKYPEWAIQATLSIRHHGFVIPSVRRMIAQAAPTVQIPQQYLTPPARGPRRPRRPAPRPGAAIPGLGATAQ
jgi:alpha-acetolactate decarboxylase